MGAAVTEDTLRGGSWRGRETDTGFFTPGSGAPMIAEKPRSPARFLTDAPARTGSSGEPDRHNLTNRYPAAEQIAEDDLRWYLMNKYRLLLTGLLTPDELGELRTCCRRRPGAGKGADAESLRRFVRTLQNSVPEEILRREIAGIAALMALLREEDLPALRRRGQEAR